MLTDDQGSHCVYQICAQRIEDRYVNHRLRVIVKHVCRGLGHVQPD